MQLQAARACVLCVGIARCAALTAPLSFSVPYSLPSRLHYTSREPFVADLAALAAWRAERSPGSQPQFVRADVPLKHMATPDGRFIKRLKKEEGRKEEKHEA